MDNRFRIYRQIRAQRTWRPLGKMSWWRVILGVLLLLLAFLISGVPSQRAASTGNFRLAEKLMISPAWMEKYKPELKALIEAGVLFQDGDYEDAYGAFSRLEGDSASVMKNISALKLASEKLQSGDEEAAAQLLSEVDPRLLPDAELQEYSELCTRLEN